MFLLVWYILKEKGEEKRDLAVVYVPPKMKAWNTMEYKGLCRGNDYEE